MLAVVAGGVGDGEGGDGEGGVVVMEGEGGDGGSGVCVFVWWWGRGMGAPAEPLLGVLLQDHGAVAMRGVGRHVPACRHACIRPSIRLQPPVITRSARALSSVKYRGVRWVGKTV